MTRASRTAEWKAEGSAMRGLVPEAAGRRVPSSYESLLTRERARGDDTRAVSIVCRYILMYAMSIRRMNPTDFDGHPKSHEKPEIAPVDRLRVMSERGDSTCPWPSGLAQRAHISEKDSRVAS
jgi:hypothetical protein